MHEGSDSSTFIISRQSRAGRSAISFGVAVRISHFDGVAALLSSSDLIATVPSRLAESMKRLVGVKVLPLPIPLPKIKASLYSHERFHRDPGNAWLRSMYAKLSQRDSIASVCSRTA